MIRLVLNSLVFQKLPVHQPSDEFHDTKFLNIATGRRRIAYRVARPEIDDGTVMIYFHGNAETIYDLGKQMQVLAEVLQNTIVYYDYPGYGMSDGTCTEERIKSDALEVFEYVRNNIAKQRDESRIVLFGRSLGSGPAIYTASVYKNIRALVLISPLSSVIHTKLSTNMFNRFDMFKNEDYMPYIKAPVLFFHGLADDVVPSQHSEKLYALSTNPHSQLHLFEKVGHNNILKASKWQSIVSTTFAFLLKEGHDERQRDKADDNPDIITYESTKLE